MKTFGPATLQKINGIDILNLFGSQIEMAKQHGYLLKKEIQTGTVPFLGNKIEFEVKNDGPLKKHPLLQKIALLYMNIFVFKKLIKNIPDIYKGMTYALSKEAGIDPMLAFKAGAMPDAMSILSRLVGKHVFPNIDPQTFGCTSFVMYNEMTQNGEMMVGRNLDFPCSQYWDRNPVIIYHHPSDSQKYCSITTAGITIPGITGFNESGLTVAIHQLFSRNTSADGVPIVFICTEIIRKAKTLDDAIRICKSMKRASDWSVVITSHKEQRAISVETSYQNVYVREAQRGLLAQSNFCFNPKTKKDEIFFNWTTAEDNFYRCERLIQRCKELEGHMNETEGISLLGDSFDMLKNRDSSVGRVVSTIYNVQSVFFRPEQKKFWVSTGEAPANLTEHLELPMDWESCQHLGDPKVIQPNVYSKTLAFKAKKKYALAFHHFSDTKNFKEALKYLKEASDLDPEESSFHMASGFLFLKINDYISANRSFESYLKLAQTYHEQALATLFLARTYDLLGERKTAKPLYSKYAQDSKLDKKIRTAFKQNLKRPYTQKSIDKSVFQFIFSDFLSY